MNLVRVLAVNILSFNLILMPVSGYAAPRAQVERSPLYYKVKKGDALSEVLDRMLLRPIYPLTGSLRRTIAANPGRFHDLRAPLFPHEKIYFSATDEITIRQYNDVLASGEVRIGKSERPAPIAQAPLEKVSVQSVEATPRAMVQKPAPELPTQTIAEKRHQENPAAVAPAPEVKKPPAAKPDQSFAATEDEEGVEVDSFAMEHAKPKTPSAPADVYDPLAAMAPTRRPASITPEAKKDQPFDREDDFPMGGSPVNAPRASDTRVYQSDF
jgi:hypothetical protein